MAIRPSTARDVDALIRQLDSPTALQRDAAIARLRVIAARARTRVLQLLDVPSSSSDVRIAALRVLEGLEDPAVTRVATRLTESEDPRVAIAAIQVLRSALARDTGVLERVASIVADGTRPDSVRRAALDAMADLPASVTRPLVASVEAELADQPPLDTPSSAAAWLTHHHTAPLAVLHDLICAARDRGRSASEAERREWLVVRAAAHAVLAARGSRIALYDARELFESATEPLPFDIVTAMRSVGDLSCLEPLATAWAAMAADTWWREQLQKAATEIRAREQVTNRHALVKRVRAKWPGFLNER